MLERTQISLEEPALPMRAEDLARRSRPLHIQSNGRSAA